MSVFTAIFGGRRSYLTTTKDLTRVMSRLKALYRSWAIPCAAETSTIPAIATCGWRRFRIAEFAGVLNISTNRWT